MQLNEIIDELNSYLRGEIAAVETFRQARERVNALGPQGELARCQSSHEARVSKLQQKVLELGGTPATSSGAWGAFAKLTEGGAAVFGEGAAVAALETGEDHGRDDYKRGIEKLAGTEVAAFVQELLQEQLVTHQIMSHLKNVMKSAGREPRINP